MPSFEEHGGDPSLKFYPSGGTHFSLVKKYPGRVLLERLLQVSEIKCEHGGIWRAELVASNRLPLFSQFLVRHVRFAPQKSPVSGDIRYSAERGTFAAYKVQSWIEPLELYKEYGDLGIHVAIELSHRKGFRSEPRIHQCSNWTNLKEERFQKLHQEVWEVYSRFYETLAGIA